MPTLLRSLLPVLVAGALAYTALLALVYLLQSRLLYFPDTPGRSLDATPADIGLAFEDVSLVAVDGVKLRGWFLPSPGARRVVVFCHGNAGNISHRLDWLRILHRLGLSVLIFDYRGYGRSEGRAREQGTYLDAEAAWAYLTQTRGYRPADIVLFGESLGGPIAAHLGMAVQPGAVILASTFTSVPELAAHHYRIFPVRWLSRFRYATVEYLGAVKAPVLVIHSRDDEIVPFAHGEALHRRAAEPKALLAIRGDHNGGFLLSEPALVAGMQQFLDMLREIDRFDLAMTGQFPDTKGNVIPW